MRKFAVALTVAALALAPGTAFAGIGSGGGSRGGSFGGGGSKASSGPKTTGGSPKSAGGSSAPKTSPAGAKSYSSSKASIRQPSSGPVKQPAPVTRLLPPRIPQRPPVAGNGVSRSFQAPRGRSYDRDRRFITTHREYANPYYGSYYGAWDSPFFYMWAFGMMDNDNGNNPAPVQADEGEIAQILPAEIKLIVEAVK